MTTEERLTKLEKELTRAKRRNRWLVAGATIALGIVFAAWAFGPRAATAQPANSVPKEVRASNFILVDENGNTRASLAALKDGPALGMIDGNGNIRAMLLVDKDGAMLYLKDENGKIRTMVATNKQGVGVSLKDRSGNLRAMLSVLEDEPAFTLYDESGKPRWSAP